jgi:hypothetical protein
MKWSYLIVVVLLLLRSGFWINSNGSADELEKSPLTGEIGSVEDIGKQARDDFSTPVPYSFSLVSGGLYGTSGTNLYLVDKATGTTTVIGLMVWWRA